MTYIFGVQSIKKSHFWRLFSHYSLICFDLIRANKFRFLFRKISKYLKNIFFQRTVSVKRISALLRDVPLSSCSLIFDQALGGGAYFFRTRYAQQLIARQQSALVMRYDELRRGYSLQYFNINQKTYKCFTRNRQSILELLSCCSLYEILINSLVCFERVHELTSLIIDIKNATAVPIKLLWHDYYMVCPSAFLIDISTRFCGIPHESICRQCLPLNKNARGVFAEQHDIATWRKSWQPMFSIVDKHIFPDESVLSLVNKIYNFETHAYEIAPHDMSYFSPSPFRPQQVKRLVIGVVGQIGSHKGGNVVKALADEIIRTNADIKIDVFGELLIKCDDRVVNETGVFHHDKLTDMINQSDANIFLFPSICPETFSFVLEEMMLMDLPIAGFNLGAQGRKIANYPKGKVLFTYNSAQLLPALIDFFHDLYHNKKGVEND